MIKMRLTFIDDKKGKNELEKVLENIDTSFKILEKSNIYKGRNGSKYSNVYLDLEVDKNDLL